MTSIIMPGDVVKLRSGSILATVVAKSDDVENAWKLVYQNDPNEPFLYIDSVPDVALTIVELGPQHMAVGAPTPEWATLTLPQRAEVTPPDLATVETLLRERTEPKLKTPKRAKHRARGRNKVPVVSPRHRKWADWVARGNTPMEVAHFEEVSPSSVYAALKRIKRLDGANP